MSARRRRRGGAGFVTGLGDLPGGNFFSRALDVSADGSTVVGYGSSASGTEAFRWTSGGGMVGLGNLPGGTSSVANGVSADGSTVVGASGGEAFIWDASHGMRELDVVLSDLGLGPALAGWTLTEATAISADGLTIVGTGINPSGQTEAWLAVSSCPTPIDLTSGTSGSLTGPGSSFNETRGLDVTVGAVPDGLTLEAMTLDGLNISTASATVGARVYDSVTEALVASAQTTVSTGSDLSVTIPLSVTLAAGGDYRLAFFVDAGGSGGSATLFDPAPPGGGGFPYTDATGTLEINQAYSIASDSFPTGVNIYAPRISLDVSCAVATPVPALGYPGLALLGALLLLAPACIGLRGAVSRDER